METMTEEEAPLTNTIPTIRQKLTLFAFLPYHALQNNGADVV